MAALGRLTSRKVIYRACDVPVDELACAVALLRCAGFSGANVTIPHKISIIGHLASLSREARLAGAVNVVRCSGGRLHGHNTDWPGFRDALEESGIAVRGLDAVIFGAGGAARAAACALASLGARRVHISARNRRAQLALVGTLSDAFAKTAFRPGIPRKADVAVNATPLGLPGFPDRSPAPPDWSGCAVACDLVYGRRTAFQNHALRLGARAMGGTSMLVWQALRSWEFWFGPLGHDQRQRLKNALMKELS